MFIYNIDLIKTINLANFSDWEKTELVVSNKRKKISIYTLVQVKLMLNCKSHYDELNLTISQRFF